LRQTDELWQEPGAAGFRHETAAGEDEADLGALRHDPDIHRQCHGDADADRGSIDCRDRRLSTVEDRLDKSAAARVGAGKDASAVASRSIEARSTPRDIGAPAQKARPAPVTMTARTLSSVSARSKASAISAPIRPV